ncbi:hypothetical protein B566_EDAN008581 [Ephemera danica]|nr:hypothetical protein B566_EDAN008581 [Ephemera danica]
MALVKKTPSDAAAKDMVQLSEQEAIMYQLETIANWTPQSDVWPFNYSMSTLAAAGGLSGIYINKHYRTKLKLGNMARISTYIPIVALPAIVSAVFHHQLVTQDVVIQRTACPVCVQVRAATMQVFSSIVYPMVLAPLATFTFAVRLHTYDVPYLTTSQGRIAAFQLWRKLTKPIISPLLLICAAQGILAMGLTAAQTNSMDVMAQKLRRSEQRYEEEHPQTLTD